MLASALVVGLGFVVGVAVLVLKYSSYQAPGACNHDCSGNYHPETTDHLRVACITEAKTGPYDA